MRLDRLDPQPTTGAPQFVTEIRCSGSPAVLSPAAKLPCKRIVGRRAVELVIATVRGWSRQPLLTSNTRLTKRVDERPLYLDCVEKVLFWSETPEVAARFRVVAIGEAANLNEATGPVARHATAWFICLLPGMSRLAILRRFCAVAAIKNSSWAPLGPR